MLCLFLLLLLSPFSSHSIFMQKYNFSKKVPRGNKNVLKPQYYVYCKYIEVLERQQRREGRRSFKKLFCIKSACVLSSDLPIQILKFPPLFLLRVGRERERECGFLNLNIVISNIIQKRCGLPRPNPNTNKLAAIAAA